MKNSSKFNIENEAARLKKSIPTPDLWENIQSEIDIETLNKNEITRSFFSKKSYRILAIAASLILIISIIGYRFGQTTITENNLLLGKSQLLKVIEKEKEYDSAIAELQMLAETQFDEMELELSLLYKDKLATIDSQIHRCKDALSKNPGNYHIRRYLYAALKDKRKTLEEIIKTEI